MGKKARNKKLVKKEENTKYVKKKLWDENMK